MPLDRATHVGQPDAGALEILRPVQTLEDAICLAFLEADFAELADRLFRDYARARAEVAA